MINLCLVVIATQFSETKKRETERMLQERKRFNSSSTLASNSEPGGCYEEILKYLSHLWRRARRKINRMLRRLRGRRQRRVNPERAISLRRKRKKKKGTEVNLTHPHHCHHIINASSPTPSSILAPRASPELSDIEPATTPRRPALLTVPDNTLQVPSQTTGFGSSADSVHSPAHSTDRLHHSSNLLKSQQSSPLQLTTSLGSSAPSSSSHPNVAGSWAYPDPTSLLTVPVATHNANTKNLSALDLRRRSSDFYYQGRCLPYCRGVIWCDFK